MLAGLYGISISFSASARIEETNLWCSNTVFSNKGDVSYSTIKNFSTLPPRAVAILTAVVSATGFLQACPIALGDMPPTPQISFWLSHAV